MIFSIPEDLPECPRCGTPIKHARCVGPHAFLQPCGHYVAETVLRPEHLSPDVLTADGGEQR